MLAYTATQLSMKPLTLALRMPRSGDFQNEANHQVSIWIKVNSDLEQLKYIARLVWFNNFLIFLSVYASSLLHCFKEWYFPSFTGSGMGHPSKIQHVKQLTEGNISGKIQREKKIVFRKTAKWNHLSSPELFTLVLAKINSLVNSGVLNRWKGHFLPYTWAKYK